MGGGCSSGVIALPETSAGREHTECLRMVRPVLCAFRVSYIGEPGPLASCEQTVTAIPEGYLRRDGDRAVGKQRSSGHCMSGQVRSGLWGRGGDLCHPTVSHRLWPEWEGRLGALHVAFSSLSCRCSTSLWLSSWTTSSTSHGILPSWGPTTWTSSSGSGLNTTLRPGE